LASRIPQSFIDELVSRVDIVEVIDERVPLKKAGRDYMARCPFHEEKSASFSVSQTKQFYYCFGCAAHGTVIGFLMDYAHLDFTEAIHDLAQRAGMMVPREAATEDERASTVDLYELLERASHFFQKQLRDHTDAATAVTYLKARGLSGETAAQFGVGYAPPGWDSLLKAIGTDVERRQAMVRSGLTIEKGEDAGYDRFRNRVMFPIRDRRGRVIGFGARSLGDDTPKYLNSPETPVFHKGQELYGYFEARKATRQLDSLYVVEGYMDVVALAQFGITNAVATLGTAATADHIGRLFRTTPNVIFCFDGDAAGRRAAWRAAQNLLPLFRDGWLASFMFLPEGEDPDSLVRSRGKSGFEELASQAVGLSTFLFEHLSAEVDLSSLEGRARLFELARPLLTQLTEAPAFANLARQQLQLLSGMDGSELSRLLPQGERAPRRTVARRSSGTRGSLSLVRKAITYLLHHPELGSLIGPTEQLSRLEHAGTALLVSLLELTKSSPTLTTGAIVERFRADDEGRHLAKLVVESTPVLDEGLETEFTDTIGKLEKMVEDQRFDTLAAKAKAGPLSSEEEREFKRLVSRPDGDASAS
jgi:DNA primase